MRTITVDGIDFEWKCGKSFIRVRGNGHVQDVQLENFIVDVSGGTIKEREAYAKVHLTKGKRFFGIEPSDVVRFIRLHGWLNPKEGASVQG